MSEVNEFIIQCPSRNCGRTKGYFTVTETEDGKRCECSVCGQSTDREYYQCPHCGVEIKGFIYK